MSSRTTEGNQEEYVEYLLREVIKGYQEAWNRHNDDIKVKYEFTMTSQKMPMPHGESRTIGYLRLERIRTSTDNQEERLLVHQEITDLPTKQRVDPRQLWKQQLMMQCLARLISGGLEYAELLNRVKKEKEEGQKKLDLIVTNQMPAPIDENYKMWLNKERAKEGL